MNRILYIIGTLIVISNIFYRPYSDDYINSQWDCIDYTMEEGIRKLKAEKNYITPLNKATAKGIIRLTKYRDSADISKDEYKSLTDHICTLQDQIDKYNYDFDKHIIAVTTDVRELKGALSYKISINKMSYYGFFAFGMFMVIYASDKIRKDKKSENKT